MRALVMAAALVSIVAVGACQRPDVQKMADGALESVNLDDKVDANYDKDDKVVHLSGTVPTDDDRNRADDVVRASIGDLAQVANEIVVEGLNEKSADDLDRGIETRFDTLWSNSAELKDYDVDFAVTNGVGTLTGDVGTEAERARFEEMARSIPGVTDVVNSIKVNPEVRRPRGAR
jgi:osmotically-inducible protein OsmY